MYDKIVNYLLWLRLNMTARVKLFLLMKQKSWKLKIQAKFITAFIIILIQVVKI